MRPRTRPRVVIIGGGVAALEAALALRALGAGALELQLVAAETHFWYRPLAVAEPFGLGSAVRFPLAELAAEADAELVTGFVAEVDDAARAVRLARGAGLAYDAALVATGTRALPAVPGALTFRGPADADAYAALLREAEAGAVEALVFAAPTGATWPLPLYELALLTHRWLVERGARDRVGLRVVTPEDTPLAVFGPTASAAVARLLDESSIDVLVGRHPDSFADGVLTVFPRASLRASHVVALPRLEGAPPDGIPRDRHGFVPTDEFCRVRGTDRVFAAGDATTIPMKQGGLAAQQADVAAAAIANELGLPVEREPFRPVLRGLLLTGSVPRYLRADPAVGASAADVDPLWWPPAKIVGRHLAPFLAARVGGSLEAPARGDVVPVEVALGGQ